MNDPALPDGAEIEVPGLGVFKNGSTRQVSEEEAEYFRTVNARLVDVETDDRPAWTGAAGTELRQGPTVLQAFKDHPTVSVESTGVDKSSDRQQTSKPSTKPAGQDNSSKTEGSKDNETKES